jgi:O-antigen/teichoic acid export membrane protein
MGMYISILGAIITIVFLYLLIPHYGYMGAAYTTLLAYGSMTVISWIAGQKYYPVPYPVSRIGFYIAVSGVLSALSYKLFRDHFWINAAMILFYLLLIGYLEKLPLLWRNLKVRS